MPDWVMKVDKFASSTARRIHKRGLIKKASFLSGPKLDGMIQVESDLEATLCMLLMLDPRVVAVSPQPATFDMISGKRYSDKETLKAAQQPGGYRPKIYTPDFEATMVCGRSVFLEAKHTSWLEDKPEYLGYPGTMASWGLKLLIATEAILQAAAAQNIRMLKSVMNDAPGPENAERAALLDDDGLRFAQIASLPGFSDTEVLRLIVAGDLSFDVASVPLTKKTVLNPSRGSKAHLQVFDL